MNIGVTIARVRKTGELRVIVGPEVSVAEQVKAFKTPKFYNEVAKEHDVLQLITSANGTRKRRTLTDPSKPKAVVIPAPAPAPAKEAPAPAPAKEAPAPAPVKEAPKSPEESKGKSADVLG